MTIKELLTNTNFDKTLIVGFYGGTNFGDELLLEVLQQYFLKIGAVNIDVFYLRPSIYHIYHSDAGNRIVDGKSFFGFLKSAFVNKNIIVGGGGLWGVDFSKNTFVLSVVLWLCRFILQKNVYLLGIGYYKSTTTAGKLSAYFAGKAAKMVIVRDTESLDAFKYLGDKVTIDNDIAFYIPDLALALPPKHDFAWQGIKVDRTVETIFIAVRYFQPKIVSSYERTLEAFIETLEGYRVVLVMLESKETNPDLYMRLKKMGQGKVIVKDFKSNPLDLYYFFALSKTKIYVIAPQFHAQICAYLAGVPFMPLVYDNKNIQLLKKLGIGHTISVSEIKPTHLEEFLKNNKLR